jgi:drug/metabolite transporter (DMT)-like permease
LAVAALRGRPVLPPLRTLGFLALVGLAVELVANVGMQWALGIVGLAVQIPIDFGVMLIVSALLGSKLLREPNSGRTVAALSLLLLSVVLLGCSAGAASRKVASPAGAAPNAAILSAAVAVVCLAGAVYAVAGIAIRACVTRGVSLGVVVFMISVMAPLCLGPISVFRLGLRPLLETPLEQYGWMIGGGLFSVAGFLAVCKGFHVATVLRVNMLNASQVAMAAVAGVVLFQELLSPWLIVGVALTLAGIFLMDGPPEQSGTSENL